VLVQKLSGQWTLAGMVVAIVGIGLCGFAGLSKERELSHAAIRARVPDYHFWTGLTVACVAGAMSSCINYAITDTEPISLHLAAEGVDSLWSNSLTMAIFLTSGSVATIGWCIYLNVTNGTLGQYASANGHSLTKNYLWCTLAGMLAYSEFFFYGLAAPNMGKFSFTNLPIHLALVIVFSNVWGILLAEWRGTSARTKLCIFAGNVALLVATVLIGRGAFLDQQPTTQIPLKDMALHQGIAIDIATIQH
jgi:L-rhamnose-H+ transport protein